MHATIRLASGSLAIVGLLAALAALAALASAPASAPAASLEAVGVRVTR